MSSMGELTFFIGLQVKQKEGGIFISQDKYVAEILKKFDFMSVKTACTPIETHKPLVKDEEAADVDVTPKTSYLNAVKRIFRYLKGKPKLGLWYLRVSSFDLEGYSDSNYAGANLDRKSTIRGCQFLGRRLISWQCKKQIIVTTSTTEAEYVATANCCRQVLWIQIQMLDYGFNFMNTKIYIVNESTICIVKNPVFHSKTKHIEIRHHFIRDAYEKKLIQVLKIHTDDNVGDHTSEKAKGGLNLEELFVLCTNLSNRVLALETSKDAQAIEILKLKDQIKKLKRKCKPSISHHMAWLKSVKRLSMKKRLGRKESVSKQGRKNAKPKPTLDAFDDLNVDVSTARPKLSTAGLDVDAARQEVKEKAKEKGVSIKDIKDSLRPARSILTLKPLLTIDPKDKGKSVLEDDEKQIHAIIDSKAVVVTEASIRSSLLFNDADGTACLTNEAIFQNLALMGYEVQNLQAEDIQQYASQLSFGNITKVNFSKLIFDGMLRNLDNPKKKFLMYPRFLMVFLNNQIELGELFNDVYTAPAYNLKVFSNMSRKGLKFSGKITPLFPNMLIQSVGEDSRDSLEGTNGSEGEQVHTPHDSPLSGGHTSARAKGALNLQELFVLCTNLSNRVLALESVKDAQAAELLKLSMKKRFGKKESISKQGRKKAKPESTLDDSTFDDLDADHDMDYTEIEDVVKEGRLCEETEEFKLTADTEELVEDKGSGKKGESTEELISTVVPKIVSTARSDVDAVRQEVIDVEHRISPTTTSIFDDEDITMAQTLIEMKEEKAKEKGVSIKDIEDSSRLARSILTLKPLPTIDPKDKGKGVLEEPEPAKKMTRSDMDAAQIAKDAEVARLQGLMLIALFAANLQQEERQEYTVEERAKFLAEIIAAQRKFRAAQRAGYEESIRKRPRRRLKMKVTKKSKRQKTDVDLEEEEQLRAFMNIVPDEEEEIDYEVLDMRANGSSRYIKTFIEMVSRFDRLDFIELHSLVMQRFAITTPEGIDLVLWGDLRIMFKETTDVDLWKNQEKWIIKSWNFYENYGVHTLVLEEIDEFGSQDGSEMDL
ncbi:hypothetical protein Tco_0327608 [Tanacetum coccineum]